MDRVELPPGVSVEGGPDGGGAGGAIHKTHEVMRLPDRHAFFYPKTPEERRIKGEELKGERNLSVYRTT